MVPIRHYADRWPLLHLVHVRATGCQSLDHRHSRHGRQVSDRGVIRGHLYLRGRTHANGRAVSGILALLKAIREDEVLTNNNASSFTGNGYIFFRMRLWVTYLPLCQ